MLTLKKPTQQYESVGKISDISVTVLIPARDEPIEIVEDTIKSFLSTNTYPNTEIILVDNSHHREISAGYERLQQELGFRYLFVGKCHNKAEALNKALSIVSTDAFIVVDSDQRLVKDFIKHVLPVLFSSDKIALIQTPQSFKSIFRFQATIRALDEIFFKTIMPFRNRFNAAICCGTNFIARVETAKKVGLFSTDTVTEDIDLSWKLASHGYGVQYVNRVFFLGIPPVSIKSYYEQRKRYARGGAVLLKKTILSLPNVWRNKKQMSFVTWILYCQVASWYPSNVALLMLAVLPMVYFFLNIAAITTFIGIILSLMLLIASVYLFRKFGLSKTLFILALNISTSPYYCIGFVKSFWNNNRFSPTLKTTNSALNIRTIPSIPLLMSLVFCLLNTSLFVFWIINQSDSSELKPVNIVVLILYSIVFALPELGSKKIVAEID